MEIVRVFIFIGIFGRESFKFIRCSFGGWEGLLGVGFDIGID